MSQIELVNRTRHVGGVFSLRSTEPQSQILESPAVTLSSANTRPDPSVMSGDVAQQPLRRIEAVNVNLLAADVGAGQLRTYLGVLGTYSRLGTYLTYPRHSRAQRCGSVRHIMP
jgi:hypothetical protein